MSELKIPRCQLYFDKAGDGEIKSVVDNAGEWCRYEDVLAAFNRRDEWREELIWWITDHTLCFRGAIYYVDADVLVEHIKKMSPAPPKEGE